MLRETHHVVFNASKGGWDVIKGDASESIIHTATKEEAVRTARVISCRQNTELVIYSRDEPLQGIDSCECAAAVLNNLI